MQEIKLRFAERLRKLRENQELTQEAAAERLMLSRAVLSNYELGKREPDFDTLLRLAHFYGVTTDYLLGLSSIPDGNMHFVEEGLNRLIAYYLYCPQDSREDLLKYVDLLEVRDHSRRRKK